MQEHNPAVQHLAFASHLSWWRAKGLVLRPGCFRSYEIGKNLGYEVTHGGASFTFIEALAGLQIVSKQKYLTGCPDCIGPLTVLAELPGCCLTLTHGSTGVPQCCHEIGLQL